jgi:hypothetical protein
MDDDEVAMTGMEQLDLEHQVTSSHLTAPLTKVRLIVDNTA